MLSFSFSRPQQGIFLYLSINLLVVPSPIKYTPLFPHHPSAHPPPVHLLRTPNSFNFALLLRTHHSRTSFIRTSSSPPELSPSFPNFVPPCFAPHPSSSPRPTLPPANFTLPPSIRTPPSSQPPPSDLPNFVRTSTAFAPIIFAPQTPRPTSHHPSYELTPTSAPFFFVSPPTAHPTFASTTRELPELRDLPNFLPRPQRCANLLSSRTNPSTSHQPELRTKSYLLLQPPAFAPPYLLLLREP